MKAQKNNNNNSKTLGKKLHLNKETVRELKSSELERVAGGDYGPSYSGIYCKLNYCRPK